MQKRKGEETIVPDKQDLLLRRFCKNLGDDRRGASMIHRLLKILSRHIIGWLYNSFLLLLFAASASISFFLARELDEGSQQICKTRLQNCVGGWEADQLEGGDWTVY